MTPSARSSNAATRSLLTGSDLGDNIIRALPSVIGQTIGNIAAQGIASAGKPNSGISLKDGYQKDPTAIDLADPSTYNLDAKYGGTQPYDFGVSVIWNDAGAAPAPSVDIPYEPVSGSITPANDTQGLLSLVSQNSTGSGTTPTSATSFDPHSSLNSTIYTVQKGDTLSSIAESRDGLTSSDLAWLNNIPDENLIFPGQSVLVPNQSYLDVSKAARDQFINTATFINLVGKNNIPDEVNLATVPALSADGLNLVNATPIGSALKTDRYHNLPDFVKSLTAYYGTVFHNTDSQGRPYTLYQVAGSMPKLDIINTSTGPGYQSGRFEYIIDSRGFLTHQLFVPGGTINGIPVKR